MSQKTTRKEFFAATAAGAALIAGAGFTRAAAAEDLKDAITQTATIGLNPDMKDEALEAIKTLVKAVEENEPGVLAYIPHITQEGDKVFFFEIYKDEEALRTHGQQPHMAALRTAFGAGILKMPLEIVKMDRVAGFYRA